MRMRHMKRSHNLGQLTEFFGGRFEDVGVGEARRALNFWASWTGSSDRQMAITLHSAGSRNILILHVSNQQLPKKIEL